MSGLTFLDHPVGPSERHERRCEHVHVTSTRPSSPCRAAAGDQASRDRGVGVGVGGRRVAAGDEVSRHGGVGGGVGTFVRQLSTNNNSASNNDRAETAASTTSCVADDDASRKPVLCYRMWSSRGGGAKKNTGSEGETRIRVEGGVLLGDKSSQSCNRFLSNFIRQNLD